MTPLSDHNVLSTPARGSRRAWTLAGYLAIVASVLQMIELGMNDVFIATLSQLLVAAALLILAFGGPGGESIVRRRPLGVAAMLGYVVLMLLDQVVVMLLFHGVIVLPDSVMWMLVDGSLTWLLDIGQLVCAVVAAREMYVAGVITGGARYVAFGMIGVSTLVSLAVRALSDFGPVMRDIELMGLPYLIAHLQSVVILVAGVLVLLSADRARTGVAGGIGRPATSAYLGGALLLVAVVVDAVIYAPVPAAVLVALGFGLLATGSPGFPRVTERSILATVALVALGVWAVVRAVALETPLLSAVVTGSNLEYLICQLIGGALALIVAAQIARGSVVPAPTNRVPLIVCAIIAVMFVYVAVTGSFRAEDWQGRLQVTDAGRYFEAVQSASLVVIGIWAILLGDRFGRARHLGVQDVPGSAVTRSVRGPAMPGPRG